MTGVKNFFFNFAYTKVSKCFYHVNTIFIEQYVHWQNTDETRTVMAMMCISLTNNLDQWHPQNQIINRL